MTGNFGVKRIFFVGGGRLLDYGNLRLTQSPSRAGAGAWLSLAISASAESAGYWAEAEV